MKYETIEQKERLIEPLQNMMMLLISCSYYSIQQECIPVETCKNKDDESPNWPLPYLSLSPTKVFAHFFLAVISLLSLSLCFAIGTLSPASCPL